MGYTKLIPSKTDLQNTADVCTTQNVNNVTEKKHAVKLTSRHDFLNILCTS